MFHDVVKVLKLRLCYASVSAIKNEPRKFELQNIQKCKAKVLCVFFVFFFNSFSKDNC